MSLHHVQLHLVDSIDQVWALKTWMSERRPFIAVDTETQGLQWWRHEPRLLQVGDPDWGWAIPWKLWGGAILEILREFRGDLIMHNAGFDVKMFEHWSGVELPRHRIHDTRVQAHILNPNEPTGLKYLAERYVDAEAARAEKALHREMDRNGWGWDTVPIECRAYWGYACMDVILTSRLHQIQYPRVMAEAPRAYDLEMATVWVLCGMERRGMRLDLDYTRRAKREFDRYVDECGKMVRDRWDVSAGSNRAVLNVLQQELEGVYEFTKLTPGGALSLDKDVMDEVLAASRTDEHPRGHPLAELVYLRRKHQKLASAYLDNFLELEHGGRIHPSFNAMKRQNTKGGGEDASSGYGARTGRMSVSDPSLQNLPRRSNSNPSADTIRNCLTASEGSRLLMCDFDQIEFRLEAHFAEDPALRAAFGEGDFFVNLTRQIFNDPTIEKKDPRRQTTKNAGYACVPLSTCILTRRGWLNHDEVRVGDETLGFNAGVLQWSRVTAVHHPGVGELIRLSSGNRSFVVTPEHRWMTQKYIPHRGYGAYEIVESSCLPRGPWSIVLSAESTVGGELSVTEHEARVLGWVLSDGTIQRGKYTGAKAQAGGRKVFCRVGISQCKPHRVREIDELLSEIPHRRYVARRRSTSGYESVGWSLNPDWSRSVLARAEIIDKNTFDPWQLALRLSPKARRAMFASLHAGDGGSESGYPSIGEAAGSRVIELIEALGFLLGYYVKRSIREPTGDGWTRHSFEIAYMQKPIITGQRLQLEQVGSDEVWCVSTELGTWVMRQSDGSVVLTGNSIYGAGVPKFAQTAGISLDEAQSFMNRFNQLYPGMNALANRIATVARERYAAEEVAYVRSPLTGRRYPADRLDKAYALVNYLIQGVAAEVLKMKNLELVRAGLGEYLVLNVHDEIILDVPEQEFESVGRVVLSAMNDDRMFSVPLTASLEWGERWGGKNPVVLTG